MESGEWRKMYSCADWRISHGVCIVHTRIICTAGEIRYQIKSVPVQRDIDFLSRVACML